MYTHAQIQTDIGGGGGGELRDNEIDKAKEEK